MMLWYFCCSSCDYYWAEYATLVDGDDTMRVKIPLCPECGEQGRGISNIANSSWGMKDIESGKLKIHDN